MGKITVAYADVTQTPLTGLTPVFTQYVDKAGVSRAAPTVTELGGGEYVFEPTTADIVAGTIFVLDGGATAIERYKYDGIFDPEVNPFSVFCVFDMSGDLSAGAPTIGFYSDLDGNTRSAPTVTAAGGIAYLYTITPSAADLALGIAFRWDALTSTTPVLLSGYFSAIPADTTGCVTLATLRARVRERCDMVHSQFITDTADSLDSWINEGAQKLHDMLIQAYGEDYVEKSTTLTTVAAQSDYDLPSDFYKLLGVELPLGGRMRTILPYQRTERNTFANQPVSLSQFNIPRYKLSRGVIRLLPTPNSVLVGTLWYAPWLQVNDGDKNKLVDATDCVLFPNGWERYIVLYAAKIALDKEESDSSKVVADLAKETADLMAVIENRNADMPHQAIDLDAVNSDPDWGY